MIGYSNSLKHIIHSVIKVPIFLVFQILISNTFTCYNYTYTSSKYFDFESIRCILKNSIFQLGFIFEPIINVIYILVCVFILVFPITVYTLNKKLYQHSISPIEAISIIVIVSILSIPSHYFGENYFSNYFSFYFSFIFTELIFLCSYKIWFKLFKNDK